MPKINQEEYEVLKELDDKWKWIARDKDQQTYVYEYRPIKSKLRGQWESNWNDYYPIPHDWLQFIQWEDEEPYNIAELIEDYEERLAYEIINRQFESLYGESEETEVKTLESIREEMWEEMLRLEDKRIDQWADIKYQTLREVLQKLGHLDEPEVLSQELPVIPKSVAELLRRNKKDNFKLIDTYGIALERGSWADRKLVDWLQEDWTREDIFARAWLDGYEIEQEPKYIIDTDDIEISDGNHYLTNLTLSKDSVKLPIVGDKFDAIRFDDINQAEAIASYVGDRVEELEE